MNKPGSAVIPLCRSGVLAPFSMLLLGVGPLASAEDSQDLRGMDLIEEIVVTAKKREQSMQDIAISVTAFSGEQVRALGYTNSTDIAAQTPNLNIIQFHPTLTNVVIRGVSQNDFANHLEPPIALYSDGAYVPSMGAAHTQVFDLERIEVLRGPQGTLFGRNATGGLIHYVSNRPTDRYEGYGQFSYGSYDQITFEGGFSAPLSETVSTRISFATNHHDGVLENRDGADLRDAGSVAGRAQVLVQPAEDVEILVKAHYSEDDARGNAYSHAAAYADDDGLGVRIGPHENVYGCNGCDLIGYAEPDDDPYTGAFDYSGTFSREIYGATATLDYQVSDALRLVSVSDYLRIDKVYGEDVDATPFSFAVFDQTEDMTAFSQELRLEGETAQLRWTAGAYYLDIASETTGYFAYDLGPFFGLPFGDPFFLGVLTQESTVDTTSYAVFGHVEYIVSESVTVSGALRYTDDERRLDWTGGDNFVPPFVESTATSSAIPTPVSYDNWSARGEIAWRPVENTLTYLSVTRGHKAGNYRIPVGVVPASGPAGLEHDQEELTSVEAGLKTTRADGRVRFNASAFYYDYNDYQAFVLDDDVSSPVNATLNIVNVDAEAYGAEAELVLSPTEGLDLSIGLALMDSKVKDVALPSGARTDGELPYAPSVAINGLARYEWPVAGGHLAVQADFNYTDDFCFTVLCAQLDREDGYVLVNARVSYAPGAGAWEIAVFGRNLTDKAYRLYSLDLAALGFANDSFGAPRWWGGSVSVRW